MFTKLLREIFDFKSNEIENKSNLSKETLDKISFIFEKLDNIYKLDNKKEYNFNGYDCIITEFCSYYTFNIKMDNVDIIIYNNIFEIGLFIDNKKYSIFKNNLFVDNGILNKDEFISLVENICMVIAHFYKDYSYILESEYTYKFFEESAIKSREEARKDIVKFINNI